MKTASVSTFHAALPWRAILLAPWRSTRRGLQWYMVAILALIVGAAIAVAVFTHKTEAPPRMSLASIPAFGLAFFNAFVLAPALLLAIDARQLRLPGMQRIAWLSVMVYMVLEVALLAAVFGILTGEATTAAAILALGATTGMAWGLLPRYFSVLLGFGPMTFNALHASLHLPGAGQPGFLSLLGVLVLLGAVASVVCWRRELHAASPYGQGMSRPLIAMFRNSTRMGWNGWSGFAGGNGDSTFMLRQRPDWMQPRADLHGTGPANVYKSLRIALGGAYMPQTWLGRLRTLAWIALPSAAFVLLMGLQARNGHHKHVMDFFHAAGTFGIVWVGAFGGSMAVLVHVAQLQQRWRKTNGEVSLLALLPQLGTPAGLRRDLLIAVLSSPLRMQGLLLIVTIAAGAWLGLGGVALFALALCQLAGIGCVAAMQLNVLGLCMPSGWITVPLALLGFILLMTTVMLCSITGVDHFETPLWLSGALSIGWSVLIVALLWLGRRGWHAFQALPQPFLQP